MRTAYLEALDQLSEVTSFQALRASSRMVDQIHHDGDQVRRLGILRQPCDGRVQCAIIGNSAAGKTSLLRELLPGLADRGWLKADLTDTTSQALAISAAPADTADELESIAVESWTLEQIKALMNHPDVEDQNQRSHITVEYGKDDVVVDGSKAPAEPTRFPKKIRLTPFARPYHPTPEQAGDERFRTALTTKQLSDDIDTAPIITINGEDYSSLQVRAVVRRVALRDRFDRLVKLSRREAGAVAHLTLIDTPGLATAGSEKDEVLRHYLARKSAHILSELWREDELDIVIHLVMAGDQTTFSELLRYVERVTSPEVFEDLGQRLVLVINGMNRFFEDPDLKRRYRPGAERDGGDHFSVALIDNILEKMGLRGRLRPARICFVDSRSHVEKMRGVNSYADYYGENVQRIMRSWTQEGEPGHETLSRLSLVDDFRRNAEALANPDDCGQGFFVQQLLDLIDQRGWILLIRRFVIRSGLLREAESLCKALSIYYDEAGDLTQHAVREALRACLGLDSRRNPKAIEQFVENHGLDDKIKRLVFKGSPDGVGNEWAAHLFQGMVTTLGDALLDTGQPPPEIGQQLTRHLASRAAEWTKLWGYETFTLQSPGPASQRERLLLLHCLRQHAREVLYQLEMEGIGDTGAFETDPDDGRRIRAIRATLKGALEAIQPFCQKAGSAA